MTSQLADFFERFGFQEKRFFKKDEVVSEHISLQFLSMSCSFQVIFLPQSKHSCDERRSSFEPFRDATKTSMWHTIWHEPV